MVAVRLTEVWQLLVALLKKHRRMSYAVVATVLGLAVAIFVVPIIDRESFAWRCVSNNHERGECICTYESLPELSEISQNVAYNWAFKPPPTVAGRVGGAIENVRTTVVSAIETLFKNKEIEEAIGAVAKQAIPKLTKLVPYIGWLTTAYDGLQATDSVMSGDYACSEMVYQAHGCGSVFSTAFSTYNSLKRTTCGRPGS